MPLARPLTMLHPVLGESAGELLGRRCSAGRRLARADDRDRALASEQLHRRARRSAAVGPRARAGDWVALVEEAQELDVGARVLLDASARLLERLIEPPAVAVDQTLHLRGVKGRAQSPAPDRCAAATAVPAGPRGSGGPGARASRRGWLARMRDRADATRGDSIGCTSLTVDSVMTADRRARKVVGAAASPAQQSIDVLGGDPDIRPRLQEQRRRARAAAQAWQASSRQSSIHASARPRRRRRSRRASSARACERPRRSREPLPRAPRARSAGTAARPGVRASGEVFVGALLPAAAPDELEDLAQREQVSGRGGRKEVRDAVDRVERPRGRRVGREAEEGDNSVDVDQQQRPC